MDLYHHTNPPFTKWVVANRLLTTPFVIIDIGVQGGAHPRWNFLGPYAEVHGFDAIAEVIDTLRDALGEAKHRHYYNIALGNEDGERRFFVPANRFEGSFYSSKAGAEERIVPIRRLDSLFAEGVLPRADYIKLDCEGFEPEILKGARDYLAASDIICVSAETNFNVSPTFPRTHFQAINDILVEHRLTVFDENPVRAPAAEYAAAIARRPPRRPDPLGQLPRLFVGRPGTYDIVFCRDLAADRREPGRFGPALPPPKGPGVDMIVKSMINFELHGLMDCAVELATDFRGPLSRRLDVDKAIALLLEPAPAPRNSADVALCIEMIVDLRKKVLHLEQLLQDRGLRRLLTWTSPQMRALVPQPLRRALRKLLY